MCISRAFLVTLLVGLTLASTAVRKNEKRLILTNPTEPATWLSSEKVTSLINEKIGYVDITNLQNIAVRPSLPKDFPAELRYEELVREGFTKISLSNIQDFVTTFSAYPTRYYTATSGRLSAEWLLSNLNSTVLESAYSGISSVTAFNHLEWPQKSIIVRLAGFEEDLKGEVVLLGAHLDSINDFGSVAPGADDNASGCAVLFETLQVLLALDFKPRRTIEFHWYAAEEEGLLGSLEIAESYNVQGIDVVSMVNFDVAGWSNGEALIGLVQDYTDVELTTFLETLIVGYLDYGWANKTCDYFCFSDHYSWNSFGYPVAHPIEFDTNPKMHTEEDTVDLVNFEQVNEFVKLAIAYVVEMAEPHVSM